MSVCRFDPSRLSSIDAYLRATGEPFKPLTVRRIRVAADALDELPAVARAEGVATRPTVLVMDAVPIARAGTWVKPLVRGALESVAGSRLTVLTLGSSHHPPHATAVGAAELARQLPAEALVIALGSGTITDLTKHAVFLAGQADATERTLICCPTACTVTAYTSTMSVLTVEGVKRTALSHGPDVVLVDLTLVADAPPNLTAAGFGDMMARCVSAGDWYLSHRLGFDPNFSLVPLNLLAHAEDMLFACAAEIGRGQPAAVRHLVDAVLLAGIAMSVANQTAPISGWEHTISHYLDLTALAAGRPLGLHGAQVGAATLVAARAYARLLAAPELPAAATGPGDERAVRAAMRSHFSQITDRESVLDELWQDYHGKWRRWVADPEPLRQLRTAWADGTLRDELRGLLREPDRIAAALTAAGCPTDLAAAAGCTPQTARDAVRYAHLVRQRFTLGDLLSAVGQLDEAVSEPA